MEKNRSQKLLPWTVMLAVVVLLTLQLRLQGRIWWCACGEPNLWSGETQGRHNSQHLFDPYSLTHIPHGIGFCMLLAWLCPTKPLAWRLAIAICLECFWEVLENTSYVIERYRTATISLDYYGDSIANALADVFSCSIGFLLTQRLKWWGAATLFLVIEAVTLIWIRDSLLLNVVMLLCPIDAIKAWQMAG